MKKASFLASVLCVLWGGLNLSAQNFSEVAVSLGIDHSYGFGVHGGGVSFADFNRDGWDDLTFTSEAGKPMYFYQNNGGNSFTQLFLVDNTLETKDATWIDYDNDGDRDLFITAFGGTDKLYENTGNLNMVDVTQSTLGSMPNVDSYGAVWGDYNNDGWLDLYICHYSESGSGAIENDLYRSDGDGTFTKVTNSSGTGNGFTLTFDACFVDMDENGWQDLYVVNDKFYQANALYMNTNGNFSTDPGSGAFIIIDAMNAGGADYDDDGDFDLYVTNTSTGNNLLENDGNAQFFDVAAGTGTGVYRTCWGATFLDYDLDQDQDLYVSVNGSLAFNSPNAFLVNFADLGLNIFSEPFQFSGGLGGIDYGRNYGQAIGDLDNDGLPDMVVSRMMPDSFHIWHNDESPTGSWLKVDLFGTSSNTEGVGARVEVDLGDKTISRYRHGGQGYLSQHSHQLHFGLGSVFQIDQMRVYWPSGIIDVFNNITNLNDVISVTEGEAALPADLLRFSATLANEDVDLSWETAAEVDVDFYEIERSTDGQVFEGLHRISSRGNSSNLQSYGWLDRSLAPFPRYYRLKMVDLDGSFEYSPIERLDGIGQEAVFELGLPNPNPASDFVRIPFRLPKAGMVQLELYDLNGRLLSERQIDGQAGQNIYRLLLDDLPLSGQQLLIRLYFEGEELAAPLSVR